MKMQNAEMEFIQLDAGDVIATSGGPGVFTFSGLYDNVAKNATVSYNGKLIFDADGKEYTIGTVLAALEGIGLTDVYNDSHITDKGGGWMPIDAVFSIEAYDGMGDCGDDTYKDILSYLNEGRFQWLNGSFYQQ